MSTFEIAKDKKEQTIEKNEKSQSSRKYAPSEFIKNTISKEGYIYDETIGKDSRVCLIGDGQGADTRLFLGMGIDPKNIESINYEREEVDYANSCFKDEVGLKYSGVEMKQGDATSAESLKNLGIKEGSFDIVTLMHVLEVPDIKGKVEQELVKNLKAILKPDGELLVSQYKNRLTPEQAKFFEVEEIKAEDLTKRFGQDWEEIFQNKYGKAWHEGMLYSELSRIRTKDELIKLFENSFMIKVEETDSEYILRMKRKPN